MRNFVASRGAAIVENSANVDGIDNGPFLTGYATIYTF